MNFEYFFAKGKSEYTLLLLHGTGGDEHDLLSLGKIIAPHANLLSPRGKVQEHGMNRFFTRFENGVFDEASVRLAARELDEFIVEHVEENAIDARKVVAVGYSNGANTAAAMLLENPSSLAGAALLHGMIPLKGVKADLKGKPIFLSAGENDAMIPAKESKSLELLLAECGARVQSHWGEGGHEISRAEIAEVRSWFRKEFEKEE